jgi:flavodoxin
MLVSKTLFRALALNIAFSCLFGGARASAADRPAGKRVLVVYFSRVGSSRSFAGVDAVASASLPKGNTIVVAGMIRERVGGEGFQIVTVQPYPSQYRDTTDLARKEQDAKARPRLGSHVANMKDYDLIFLGYPIWWGTLPMPVCSFLEEYDFSGKTIIPFCTNGGSGLGRSEKDIAALCPRARLLGGLAVSASGAASARAEVLAWLAGLGY